MDTSITAPIFPITALSKQPQQLKKLPTEARCASPKTAAELMCL